LKDYCELDLDSYFMFKPTFHEHVILYSVADRADHFNRVWLTANTRPKHARFC